jgi:ligand-binding sensor domain-containing protein
MKKTSTGIWIVLSFILFNFTSLSAQNPDIAIGQWREHIPFNKVIDVAEVGSTVYAASQYGVFTYSKSDGELNLLTRLSGLSDYEISAIKADKQSGIVIIAYQTSNIDLIYPDLTIVNLSDIKRKNIIGGKKINHILFAEGNAYLSCEFGIVVVDLSRREISDTYYIGQNGQNANVNGLAYNGTHMLAATDSGMYKALFTDPNIFNYTAWSLETNLFEPTANYTSVTALNGKFYSVKTNSAFAKDTVFENNGSTWTPHLNDDYEGGFIDSYSNLLIYRNNYKVAAFNSSSAELYRVDVSMYSNADISKGFVDDAGIFWVADKNNGLIRYSNSPSNLQMISPNGPRSAAVWAMDSRRGNTWVASGSLSGDSPNFSERNGTYLFSDNSWATYDQSNDNIYNTLVSSGSPALVAVAVDPSDPEHAFFACWGVGVMESRKTGGVEIYNTTNSSLKGISGLGTYIITGGLTFDDNNNLWVVAGGNTSPLSVRRSDGTWQSFVIPNADMARFGLYQIIVDDFDQKWFIAREGASQGQGIGVFYEGDPATSSDDQFRRITAGAGSGNLPDVFVRSLAKDKEGAIWIGTNKGVSVIYNPGSVFSGNFDSQQIIIEQDGNAQYLLETEAVTAITIDGANRKWFGTSAGGVFLMSADGTKQLLNFNIDNSPLPSNAITAIAIDEKSGEVFFGTDKGIVSYRGDATAGGEACNDYLVFPNPVRHDYSGPIAIRGLVENADVKITDLAGNLVFHTIANGGQAIWNGTNFGGERVQTGIYTVFVSSTDGSESCSTKLLFAR